MLGGMISCLLTNLVFCTEHIHLLLFVIGFFLVQALFTWLATHRGAFLIRSSREAVREECVATTSKADASPIVPSTEQGINDLVCLLPEDLCGRVACFSGFEGIGALSGCCQQLHLQLWESPEVWMSLSASENLATTFAPGSTGREACDVFRRAAFRTDLTRLRSLAALPRSQPILEEAAHVACGLLDGDLPDADLNDFLQIGSRCLGAHDPESPAANKAAERLLRASRRCVTLFTEEQLEQLEYAYKSVHQLHALMLCSMKDSYEGLLEQSRWTGPPDEDPADDPDLKELLDLWYDGNSHRTSVCA